MELLGDALPLLEDLEPSEVLFRTLHLVVQLCVLDRDGGLRSEDDEHALVLIIERFHAALVREVDVAEDPAATRDGRSKEGTHRRVMRWEADGPWVGGDVGDPERIRVADQGAEEAVTDRRIADRCAFLGRDPDRDGTLRWTPRQA